LTDFGKTDFFMKILPVGYELFNVGRQTDMTKLLAVFRDFTNGYKKDSGSKLNSGQTEGQMGKLSVISSI